MTVLLCVLRERVDTIGDSWPACKEALHLLGQLSMTCHRIAEQRVEFLKTILEQWPLAGDFLTLQKHRRHRMQVIPHRSQPSLGQSHFPAHYDGDC